MLSCVTGGWQLSRTEVWLGGGKSSTLCSACHGWWKVPCLWYLPAVPEMLRLPWWLR